MFRDIVDCASLGVAALALFLVVIRRQSNDEKGQATINADLVRRVDTLEGRANRIEGQLGAVNTKLEELPRISGAVASLDRLMNFRMDRADQGNDAIVQRLDRLAESGRAA